MYDYDNVILIFEESKSLSLNFSKSFEYSPNFSAYFSEIGLKNSVLNRTSSKLHLIKTN